MVSILAMCAALLALFGVFGGLVFVCCAFMLFGQRDSSPDGSMTFMETNEEQTERAKEE